MDACGPANSQASQVTLVDGVHCPSFTLTGFMRECMDEIQRNRSPDSPTGFLFFSAFFFFFIFLFIVTWTGG